MIPQKTLCYLLFVSVVILFVFVLIKLYISFQEITDEVKETTTSNVNENTKENFELQQNIVSYLSKSNRSNSSFLNQETQKDIKEANEELNELKNEFMVESFHNTMEQHSKKEIEEFNVNMNLKLENVFEKNNSNLVKRIEKIDKLLNSLDSKLNKRRLEHKPEKFILTHTYKTANNEVKTLSLACMELSMGTNKPKLYIIPQSMSGRCLYFDDGNLTLHNCNGLFEREINYGLLFYIRESKFDNTEFYVQSYRTANSKNLFLTIDEDVLKFTSDGATAITFRKRNII
jgi:hypothetical protein